MAHSTQLYRNHLLAIAAIVFLLAAGTEASSSGIWFDLHHRFSPVVRQWAEKRAAAHAPGSSWLPEEEAPQQGSLEYHSALSRHDRALFARRRRLANNAGGQSTYTFADGNATSSSRLDGYLHYAEVEVGTPSTKFLVALDTGSDLFWVPCECKQCAPTVNATYSPRQSSTSKPVSCDNPLCDRPDTCAADAANTTTTSSSCPYEVSYVSANTGSSGVLVQDVLHVTRENNSKQQSVQAPVVLGCGQVQTGDFLKGAAAGGLMGLGMDKVSVPSVLATSGVVASDSFSMCFSSDGVGRINFGDAGSLGQAETPLVVPGNARSTYYNISVTAISVDDSKAVPVEFAVVVDSGSSYTYLSDPAYTLLTTSLNSRVSDPRADYSGQLFEYCYSVSPGQANVRVPEVRLTTKGGAVFPVPWPIVPVFGSIDGGPDQPIGYCLGVIKNDNDIDTIGQNFMTGLKVVFDRSRSVLGWEKFDCYKDVKMQDSGSPNTIPWSSDTASGSPDNAPWSPDSIPFAPLTPLPRIPSPGFDSMSSSSRSAFGGLSLILLLVLLATSMAW
ncbi:unnamed protein product [Urochloa decumbens]|uniref:Peptidase A1 domain-containing protein n=1 Tax=Urochloa decumbens TaxID=240449 RepID=A0ABC9B6T5_9POAL